MSTITIKAECHCKSNAFDVCFLASSLPISAPMCHCNACRHSTGQIFTQCLPIQSAPLTPNDTGNFADLQYLQQYQTTSASSNWFCKKCNAFFFATFQDSSGLLKWSVFPGILEKIEGLFTTAHHEFVEETCDGGKADHYRRPHGVEVLHYQTTSTDGSVLPMNWTNEHVSDVFIQPLADDATFNAYCHCGSIQLTIGRPLKHVQPNDGPFAVKPNPVSIQPQHGLRYQAAHCFCTSCRVTSGSTITSWGFAAANHVIDRKTSKPALAFNPEGSPFFVKNIEGTNQYESSPNKFRESCAKCGAHVFFWDATRPVGFIDVAPGLFDQDAEGSRVERYFAWTRTLFDDDALDRKVVKDLRDGMQEYYGVPSGIWPEI
ncbi:hypothetical protein CPB83DRAFT_194319 [Crepidotus variabilis]|uniref:CENP-V/GFA domain-containing protein n=1 Tax=Crepidotus variabilis TaxID=179855 RepID=A0A9P6JS05_9AGAR|nr:hypothetical protein CPB83DRAFT_194319 [Crepidotus variabilis]